MNELGQLNPFPFASIAFLTSGIFSALFGQPDFGLILVSISALIAYLYEKLWKRGKCTFGLTSHWQQGRFIAGQHVSHFGRQAYVVAVPVHVVPRHHVPIAYHDEFGCFATVPWSELQHPQKPRIS